MGQKRRNVELCTDQVYSPKALYAYTLMIFMIILGYRIFE